MPQPALSGRVALVSGASGGLGAEICDQLAAAGADLLLLYCDGADRVETVADSARRHGRRALTLRADLSDAGAVETAVARGAAEFERLDILVNNAGMATGGRNLPPGDLAAVTPEIWDEMQAVNLRAPFLLARAAAPFLRAAAPGHIVNIGSTIALGRWGASNAYAVSKAAIVPLTRYLAESLAPDVMVNCVAPGLMEGTNMSAGASERYLAGWREAAVSGRTAPLPEVAAQVLRFCAVSATTGQTLVVDGGIHYR